MEKINEILGIADKAVASTKTQTATVIPRPQTSDVEEDDLDELKSLIAPILLMGSS